MKMVSWLMINLQYFVLGVKFLSFVVTVAWP